ncbi:MAG: hypothetical protein GVY04_14850 [Cyanobacteria bacterium]|nr:hypothetical protein [Cyanobacteria bacterium GSL.Bin1]
MKIKFLLDENLPPRTIIALQRRHPEIDILRVGQIGAPALGTPDPEILLYLESRQRILVTDNRRSMPKHLEDHWSAQRQIWGLLWIRPRTSVGFLAEELALIWELSEAEEWIDQTAWIPL